MTFWDFNELQIQEWLTRLHFVVEGVTAMDNFIPLLLVDWNTELNYLQIVDYSRNA
jgi:hypothetical protein